MPIRIPQDLPAYQTLTDEKIFVMAQDRAEQQDIRPLRILILNLMPQKIETEIQLLRLLSNTPLQVDVELMQVASHVSKHTPQEHLLNFYTTFDQVRHKRYDGMIITGAPVELLEYSEVDYWDEICEIMEWTKRHVFSTLHICWGAQAGLYYHFGVPKYPLERKMFGVFPHRQVVENSLLLKGFDEIFMVPHSRNTEVRAEDIEAVPALQILAESDLSGVYLVANRNGRQFFITGHSEYDRNTLAKEYFRDLGKGLDIAVPYGYFPDDDPEKTPTFSWCGHANLMFSNWLNYCVYQLTPYDLEELAVRNWNWQLDV